MKRLVAATVAIVMAASPVMAQTPPADASPPVARRETVRASDDFYRHANLDWLDATPAPAPDASVTAFSELRDLSRRRVRELMVDIGQSTDPDARRIQALDASFMDRDRVEAAGLAPIAPLLVEIRDASTHAAITALAGGKVADLGDDFFSLTVGQADEAPNRPVVRLFPAHSVLPTRYLTDPRGDSRQAYQRYVEDSLTAIGWPNARRAARDVVTLHTALDRLAMVNGPLSYEQISVDQLERLAPDFDWRRFLASAGLGDIDTLVVANGAAITRQARLISETPVATLQAWQAFAVFDTSASYLSAAPANLRWAFRGKTLAGQTEPRSRADEATALLDVCLSDAVGRLYVARWFSPADKATVQGLAEHLREALARRLQQNDWLSVGAKSATLQRLAATRVEIGYPDQWRDYSDLPLSADDLLGNVRRCRSHAWRQQLKDLASGEHPQVWSMPPHQVNALYSDTENLILLPAALLQPPFYDPQADAATNYGALGAVVGHQFAYAVAPESRPGRLRPEWTAADLATYDALRARLGRQYAGLEPTICQSACVNLTMLESAADVTGLQAAFDAWDAAGRPGTNGDAAEAERRFFYGWARVWRGRLGENRLLNTVAADPHAPLQIRATLGPRNIDVWYHAFDVQPDEALYLPPEQRLSLW